MSQVPQTPESSLSPRAYGKFNGQFIGAEFITVTQTSYGVADTISLETYMDGQPDFGAISQSLPFVPLTIMMSYAEMGTLPTPLLNGILNDIENDYDNDAIAFTGRGLLANLVDAKMSVFPSMNQTVTQVITQTIQRYGLTPNVAATSQPAGAILKSDYVTSARNMKALDFIHALCSGMGWTVRAVGNTVVCGPPPDLNAGYILRKNWAQGGLTSLNIKHNALHNRNIKVKVVSYVQSKKSRSRSKKGTVEGPAALEVFGAIPHSGSGTTVKGGRTGQVSGYTSVGERDNIEEYVVPVANLDQEHCDLKAQQIADDINRHEFVARLRFAPSVAELKGMLACSPDFLIQLTGCSQRSNNGIYYPKHVTWTWAIGKEGGEPSGLLVDIIAVNHPNPQPTGGLGNATEESVG